MGKKRLSVGLAMVIASIWVILLANPIQAAVKITPTGTINITKNQTAVFKVNTSKKISWKIKNQRIVKIVSTGKQSVKVKGLRKGTATLKVTVKGQTYTRKIRVWNPGEYQTRSFKKTGQGDIYLINESGDTRQRKELIVYNRKAPAGYSNYCTIGFNIFKPAKPSLMWIYLDKKLEEKQFVSYGHQGQLGLQWASLKKGVHTVEIIAYKNDNPSGKAVVYRKLKYRVIEQ